MIVIYITAYLLTGYIIAVALLHLNPKIRGEEDYTFGLVVMFMWPAAIILELIYLLASVGKKIDAKYYLNKMFFLK